MPHDTLPQVLAVRRFNRFYTKQFGLFQNHMLGSPYSLVEARVLYDLANHAPLTAKEIACDLALDAGYLSRILKRFETDGMLKKERSAEDGRSQILSLTEHGMDEARMMAALANDHVGAMLNHLDSDALEKLVRAMQTVEETLDGRNQERAAIIRSHRAGDIGWVVEAHGRLYAEEYGFDERFEALVACIAADFISDYDPRREHCWIAEVDGQRAGSIFLVRESDKVAKLRMLLLTPEARGMGLGKKLVAECLSFARAAGYESVVLWTKPILSTARRIYENAGFQLEREETITEFGVSQQAQFWRLDF
ncbi:MAG: MarR family transcriptional regulator [Alphaproteobacteria bacterium]|nr:MarR family transcriptional regulator [Alphaproteobacteria bacterium]